MKENNKKTIKRIPVGDFKLDDDEKKAISQVLDDGRISEWKKVNEFERLFADYIGSRFCIAVSSGTAALMVGLLALSYDKRFQNKKGKKIITTPLTYISTTNAIVLAGFEPVFVDIDLKTFTLDIDQIEHLLNKNNPNDFAGIIPVHLMGYPNDMDRINSIAERFGLFVFEDSAQAHGSTYHGKKTGSLSILSEFSFYVAHNIQAGEMGCITTSDEALCKLIRQLKANGRLCDCAVCTRGKGICPGASKYGYDEGYDYDPRFTHEHIAYNFKTTEFTAALGVSQIKKADSIFNERQKNVKYLNEKLNKFGDIFQLPLYDVNVSYLAYPLVTKENKDIYKKLNRKWIRQKLEEAGVENRPLFGCIPTQQPAFSHLRDVYKNKLPVANYVGQHGFYIGCHQYLDQQDLDYIVDVFEEMLFELTGENI